jgi:hypothetical protein
LSSDGIDIRLLAVPRLFAHDFWEYSRKVLRRLVPAIVIRPRNADWAIFQSIGRYLFATLFDYDKRP